MGHGCARYRGAYPFRYYADNYDLFAQEGGAEKAWGD